MVCPHTHMQHYLKKSVTNTEHSINHTLTQETECQLHPDNTKHNINHTHTHEREYQQPDTRNQYQPHPVTLNTVTTTP